jgi:hypothetical protein
MKTKYLIFSFCLIMISLSCVKERINSEEYKFNTTIDDISNNHVVVSSSINYNFDSRIGFSYNNVLLNVGVCWSKSNNPTIKDDKLLFDDVEGYSNSFYTIIDDLDEDTEYFLRTFAENELGIFYDTVISFKTYGSEVIVTTVPITSISSNSAISGGMINGYIIDEITAKGVCYSQNANPTIDNSMFTNDGTGNDDYSSSLNNLESSTTYFVRAYIQYNDTILYGNELSFTTTLPQIIINTLTPWGIGFEDMDIYFAKAISGGLISYEGNEEIIARGVCYSTNSNPTLSDNHTTNGTGVGEFHSHMHYLTLGVTYYVRAYATTNTGTVYGDVKSFYTGIEL